jgi:negative regulator of replication initiation
MSHTTGGLPGGQGVIIEVDDDIYHWITGQQGDGETCNDVVRRLLGMPPAC